MLAHHTSQLNTLFGFDEFRTEQWQVIERLLAGESCLAVFPTGAGKSLCYQYSATQLVSLTLVVSPLLALMKDQLSFLCSKGIPAASIDSSMTPDQVRQVMHQVKSGAVKILMVSVERFKNERFRQFIQTVPISMLVVDEAHCISEWGHNFRPDYLKLPNLRQALKIPQVLLLTATATDKVKADMAERFSISSEAIIQTGFYRPNLSLEIVPANQQEKEERLTSLLLTQSQHAGIVYVTQQQTAENVAKMLIENGLVAAAYHAGLPLEVRENIQNQFMLGQVKIVVATIAFGMGVDKSNIRFVVHYDLPKSIENYSQEIGRAGRDGLPSQCVILANLDGLTTLENFVYGDTPEPQAIQRLITLIQHETVENEWECQLSTLSMETNIKQLPLKTLLVQMELMGVLTPKYTYFADFKYKFIAEQSHILSKFQDERRTFLMHIFEQTNFKRVWGTLSAEGLYSRFGYPRSRVVAALEYLNEKGFIEIDAKKSTDVFGVDLSLLADKSQSDGKLDCANVAHLGVEMNASNSVFELLVRYSEHKEIKELQRLEQLVNMFQSKHCLSQAFANYFGDYQVSTECGHCSVCLGNVATLGYSQLHAWPTDTELIAKIEAVHGLIGQRHYRFSNRAKALYLAGLSLPQWRKLGITKLAGFASCHQLRFAEIVKKVNQLFPL
ncbi:RecQ family ATP-dependent DNA helicase [Shewanella gelidii]|uniref:ATP-dependent DNA helicase RecQ n=1 Tax=Shewanella gelidii TaxID=1642821 RepID=A0A917NCV8_9GAMM|nr:RecQ family ATP-dependent DNA helicase [Shewanella gelidii]MCL1097999.1 RecQ family ATP-dependent DNA helicase [Shewanella gelidii]GGI85339.1 ATP-dependent DNA helicase RecQ [Shewanella gelidii]